eukprot:gnl/TRDRNA2_/TRDRNA2_135653_c0_seq1.p1 gnl/TRDRNA2_/TRDRNA2_135653_c0~~gnl/TRDRNA2_/TRDRNA2_135653_c0_seq1.p1  ORF type:complete len:725 (-),score=117.53 gnl/TRDRNA2_/TRDRNA2_135653_c0_seq1:64-2148(-)
MCSPVSDRGGRALAFRCKEVRVTAAAAMPFPWCCFIVFAVCRVFQLAQAWGGVKHRLLALAPDEEGEPLRESNLTAYSYDVFEPYVHGFGFTAFAASRPSARHNWGVIEAFADALAKRGELGGEVTLVVVGAGFGEAAFWMALELREREAALRERLGVPDLALRCVLTTRQRRELELVMEHPYFRNLHAAGAIDFATFDLLNQSEPLHLLSGLKLAPGKDNLVFVLNYVLAALPFDFAVARDEVLLEARISVAERPAPNGTGWRDAAGCPCLLRAFDFRWGLRPATQPAPGTAAQAVWDAALALCSGANGAGAHLPTGAWEALLHMRKLARHVLIIVFDEFVRPCLCVEQPPVNWLRNLFAVPVNVKALGQLAEEQLGLHVLPGQQVGWQADTAKLEWEDWLLLSTVALPPGMPGVSGRSLLAPDLTLLTQLTSWTTAEAAEEAMQEWRSQERRSEFVWPETVRALLRHVLNMRNDLGTETATHLLEWTAELSDEHVFPTTSMDLPEIQVARVAFELGILDLVKRFLSRAVGRYGYTAEWARLLTWSRLKTLTAEAATNELQALERDFREFLERRSACRLENMVSDSLSFPSLEPKEQDIFNLLRHLERSLTCTSRRTWHVSLVLERLHRWAEEARNGFASCAPADVFEKCEGPRSFWLQDCPRCWGHSEESPLDFHKTQQLSCRGRWSRAAEL